MRAMATDLHSSIYLLADHLDAALAAGEDLLALSLIVTEPLSRARPRDVREEDARLGRFIWQARTFEASLIAHVLQARRRAQEVPRPDAHLKPLVSLFLGGTAPLLDAAADYGDPAVRAFESGVDRLSFLRSRGLIAPDAGALMPTTPLDIDDRFELAGRIELGPLLDLIATFLEALDLRFGLYTDDDIAPPPRVEPELPMVAAPQPEAEIPGARAKSLAEVLAELQRTQ